MGNGPKSRARRAGKRKKNKNRSGGRKNMPKRYVEMVPKEIRFVERDSGEEIEGDDGHMDWKKFLQKVEDNPKWITTYKLGVSMDAIWDAFHEAIERDDYVMVLAEEDWKNLEDCCQNPQVMVIGPTGARNVPGWGIHPRMNRQMLCFPKAVINAKDKDPRAEVKKAEEEAEPENIEGEAAA